MTVTSMSDMWALLDTYTLSVRGEERPVNPNNEWGGFSRHLRMPVFTAWRDRITFDKLERTTTALVLDDARTDKPVGVNNQRRWIQWAFENNEGVAAFFIIHAADEDAKVRKVKYIDSDKVFIGKIIHDESKILLVGKPRVL